ncbi:MAG: PQQ-binding-like beta-propeller repeat protein [Polyangiaceae bacterium]
MHRFEIYVAPNPVEQYDLDRAGVPASEPSSGTRRARRRAREVIDIFLGGANVTARVPEGEAFSVLRDIARAVHEIAQSAENKAIVRFCDEPWELCLERFGKVAALSVYRAGNEPQVVAYDQRVAFSELVDGVLDAMVSSDAAKNASPRVARELEDAAKAIRSLDRALLDAEVEAPSMAPAVIEVDRDVPVAFGAELQLRRARERASSETHGVERTDLHALLFRGQIRAEIRGKSVSLGDGHPFLFAEQLVELASRALTSWEAGQEILLRTNGGGMPIALRVAAGGDAALTLVGTHPTSELPPSFTFPSLSVPDFVEASLAFGRAIARALLRRDRQTCMNLRLSAFRRKIRETGDALREVCRDDACVNLTPEPYRAFAVVPPRGATSTRELSNTRLRYGQMWRALVPGIDLRGTFLCGDRLVVGAATETFCLDRMTGEVMWRVPTTRATSVVTPGGIARILPDGEIRLHDFGDGEISMRTRITPRLGAPPAGAVVNVPGLPRLLIVTEGERHLVAIDLASGELRWRYAWGRGGALRMKRAGRLLYVASGDSALTALDVQTGAVVWRVRNRLRFRTTPVLAHDSLVALAGGAHSFAEIVSIDPFSGHLRWKKPLSEGPCTVEGGPLVAADVAAATVRDRHGLKLSAFDLTSGDPLWSSERPVAPVGTSWLALDDLFFGNSPTGELVAIEAASGDLRYRHILGVVLEADVPRRLEPVLRSGALFVPHVDVHVFRPGDGAKVATIGPCEAIPDLVRVDEKCNVFVAEESGHLVAFGAGPRLSLVR